MEIPELTLVRRTLKEFDLDPALALAVLLKSLGDDHLAVIATLDRDPDDEEPATTLEAVLRVIRGETDRNGEAFCKGMRLGMTEDQVSGVPKFAGNLMLLQDAVRELVAGYADHLDRLNDLQAPGETA